MSSYDPPARFPLPNSSVVPFRPLLRGRGPVEIDIEALPLDLLLAIMRSNEQPMERRIDCAKAALPYCHTRLSPSSGPDDGSAPRVEISGGLPQEDTAS
jgi:hypothetical protein